MIALLRVYNDIFKTVGKCNGSFLVLLNLSAVFETINHDNLFYILERLSELAVVHYGLFSHIFFIVHREFKLMVLCLISLVCCVGCHMAQFWEQRHFASICFHLVRYLDTIILSITSTLITHNSTFNLNVRILWNHCQS